MRKRKSDAKSPKMTKPVTKEQRKVTKRSGVQQR